MDLDSDLRLPQGVAQVSSEDPVPTTVLKAKLSQTQLVFKFFVLKKLQQEAASDWSLNNTSISNTTANFKYAIQNITGARVFHNDS